MHQKKTFINFLTLLILTLLVPSITTTHCSEGSLPFYDHCVECPYIPGCALYADDASCSLCQYGYQKYNGSCKESNDSTRDCCVRYDIDGKCQVCSPGLQLKDNSCLRFHRPGCLKGEHSICHNCAANYQNRNGKCFKKIPNCLQQSSKGYCLKCQSDFTQINGLCSRKIYVQVSNHCVDKNQYGCIACGKGYHLTKYNQCQKDQIGCIRYFQGQCLLCKPNFLLEKGKCLIQGCKQERNNECLSCRSEYQLVNGLCLIENCLQSRHGYCTVCNQKTRLKYGKCVQPVDKCQRCQDGYFQDKNGKCIRIIKNCQFYDRYGNCLECKKQFIKFNDQCVLPGCQLAAQTTCIKCFENLTLYNGKCEVKYCQQFDRNTLVCAKCQNNYHLQNFQCVKDSPLCTKYSKVRDNYEMCIRCIDSYYLSDRHECLKRERGCIYQEGRCASCFHPFVKDHNKCIIRGCISYDEDQCTSCTYPFLLKNGSCVIEHCAIWQYNKCIECQDKFHLHQEKCIPDDPKCSYYYKGQCLHCVQNFTLNAIGNCVGIIEYCQVYGEVGCSSCKNGYKIEDGICKQTQINCVSYDDKHCIECVQGYHLEKTKCILDDPYCAGYTYPENYHQRCKRCIPEYFMNNHHRCQKTQRGCIYIDGICSNCTQPYIYDEKQHGCKIRGCARYCADGCERCQYPFQLQNYLCSIYHCSKYVEDECTQCIDNHSLIQGQCYRKDPHCLIYDANFKCSQCIVEYEIYEGICVKEDKNCEEYSRKGGCLKCKTSYYLSHDYVCLPEEPGCIYQHHRCAYCEYPFTHHFNTCTIKGCQQYIHSGCFNCRQPFQLNNGICGIPNCVKEEQTHCEVCRNGYHLKEGSYCEQDHHTCLKYDLDGNCQVCVDGYLPMANGQCIEAQPHCKELKEHNKCIQCQDGYFLNRFYNCELKGGHCIQYNGGVCSKCQQHHYLHQFDCLQEIEGCVRYKDDRCTTCKQQYQNIDGDCRLVRKPSLQQHTLDFTPTSIIHNLELLSPVSRLGKVFFSSFYNINYMNPRLSGDKEGSIGWKAEHERSGEYVGYDLGHQEQPVTFYAVQLEGVSNYHITQFHLEYSVDGNEFIRIGKVFHSQNSSSSTYTALFHPLYARAIRLVVNEYSGWPATKVQFYYYDYLRTVPNANFNSVKQFHHAVEHRSQSNIMAFNPKKACIDKDICFTGLQLCQVKQITSLSISCSRGSVRMFYVVYSVDGHNFLCYEKCKKYVVDRTPFKVKLKNVEAKNVRVYPVDWEGDARIVVSYEYK